MTEFLSVVRVERGEVYFDVPSIQYVIDQGFSVEPVNVHWKEGTISTYMVFLTDTKSIEVMCWENVHPDDWSVELNQLNHSFV